MSESRANRQNQSEHPKSNDSWSNTGAAVKEKKRLAEFPHHQAIAKSFDMPDFVASATVDPSVRELGAEAATVGSQVRFASWPSVEVAAHEAAHVVQGRQHGRPSSDETVERQAGDVANRVVRGLGAGDLMRSPALVSASERTPHLFVPKGMKAATHTVSAGETLESISKDVYGDEKYADAIRRANPGVVTKTKEGDIKIADGAVLKLPDRPDAADPWVNPFVSSLLLNGGVWTEEMAEAALKAYFAESPGHRDAMVSHYGPLNTIPTMLATLPPNSTQAGGPFEAPARDLLQRIQRVGAKADAATQGLADEKSMAKAQADEMISRNTAAAAAKLPPAAAPPDQAQIQAEQAGQVAQGSIAPQLAHMTAAQETTINNKLNHTLIPKFVTWAQANHPELGLTAANIRADARAIFNRGANIIAFADGSRLRAVVGDDFMQMVDRDPAYALPVVVHEIWGHNTYEGRGKYGTPGAEYGLDLYDKAAAKMPGYHQPVGQKRTSEIDKYGYQETEMYSLMRQSAYFTPNKPADEPALGTFNFDPGPEIQDHIQKIHDAYEVRVGRALLRGLFLRFTADPTVDAKAMDDFRSGVNAVYGKPDSDAILKLN